MAPTSMAPTSMAPTSMVPTSMVPASGQRRRGTPTATRSTGSSPPGGGSARTSTSRPLEVLSRVTRLARHLDRHRGAAFAAHGLEPWEFDVLAALRRAGAPYELSPGQLTAETLVTSGTMTNRIDRLEARTLVRRAAGPRRRARGARPPHAAPGASSSTRRWRTCSSASAILLAGLGPQDAAALAALLRRLVAPFDGPPEP